MIKLAIAGAAGRMGGRIIALAAVNQQFEIVAALEMSGHPNMGSDAGVIAGAGITKTLITADTDAQFDVLIDFSQPAGTEKWIQYCRDRKCPIVIGTTGQSPEQLEQIETVAKQIPILKAANMSVGINLMLKLAAQVATTLGDDYDIEITETHHRFKQDAPSGTALALCDSIVQATQRDKEKDVINGRAGHSDRRPPRQIGMHALRVGDTIGEHEIHFGNLGETVVLKHSAHTRDTFASGALRAAAWLTGKPAGRYDMHDVLGFDKQ